MSETDEMKANIISRLATMLMEKNPTLSIEEALDDIFKSDTYQKIMNDKTGLYYQSAGYVYSFLEDEFKL